MRTIYIIEDEPMLAEILIDMISTIGHKVVAYQSWNEVNANLIHENDVILADLTGTGQRKNVPCKVYSMSGDSDLNPDFIKPFNFDKLITTLAS